MSEPLRFGIVGTGMIAAVIADAVKSAANASLTAVASRRRESAEEFAAQHGIGTVHDSWQELATANDVDAVYACTPTGVREEICVGAAQNGKHVLGDKPFADLDSLKRITAACRAGDVAFMDATHFVHHPRTAALKATLAQTIGPPRSVRSAFFFPFLERDNIRFNLDKEPTGAVGDMAWYSMRAVTEFLPDRGRLVKVAGHATRDEQTGAAVGGAGVVVFETGATSTFDFGYNAGVTLMDLDILGSDGMVRLDDYVLDWAGGFPFDNPDYEVGYTLRIGDATPDRFEYISTPSATRQAVIMIERFAELARDPAGAAVERSIAISEETQELVDAVWNAVK